MSTDDRTFDAYIGSWVFFGVSLLLATSSSYIARLLFSIFNGFKYNGKSFGWMPALQRHMLYPVNILIKLLFLWVAFLIAFPYGFFLTNFESLDLNGLLDGIQTAISFILSLCIYLALCYATYRFIIFLQYLADYLIKERKIDENSRHVVSEGFDILFACLILAVAIGGLALFSRYRGFNDNAQNVLSLFYQLNFLTPALLIALAPVLRDYVAGLALFFDRIFNVGDSVEIPGVCPFGVVEQFRLRNTLIRITDKSLVYLPNTKLMRCPLINFAEEKTSMFQLLVKLPKDAPSAVLRRLERQLGQVLYDESDIDHETQIWIEDTYTLHINKLIRHIGLKSKFTIQTDLILKITEFFEKFRFEETPENEITR